MNGKQHLVSGVAIVSIDVAIYEQIVHNWTNEPVLTVITNIKDFIFPNIIFIPIACVFFLFGLLLPDCDNRKSMIGRMLYVPFEHRTWTHTLWVVLILFGFGFLFRPIFALAFGYFLHLFCDSFSKCGVCWLYPITKYKSFGHAKIKDKHFVYLYGSDATGWIVCGAIMMLAILYIIGVIGFIPPLATCVDSIDNSIESFISIFVK